MHDLANTIVAVSSPAGGVRSIIRITGPQALSVGTQIFEPSPGSEINDQKSKGKNRTILTGAVRVTDELALDGRLYLFFAPRSYTGEPLAEIHIDAGRAVVETLVQTLLARGLRPAGPGEFTARAYLNGKLALTQAEAVNEVISSSNQLQLQAAEKLLGGRLARAAEEIRSALLDCLSLIEAGLDFSGEDIEFISASQAAEQLAAIQAKLEELLAGSIRYETLLDLPAIGIAGAPNAGKSSLLNALLGWERSIVSEQPRTTRDVLSGVLTIVPSGSDGVSSLKFQVSRGANQASNRSTSHLQLHTSSFFQCVLFDCAGLIATPDTVLDELAQRAAVEALASCRAVLFCVDIAKPNWSEDLAIRTLIQPRSLVYVATKCDLAGGEELPRRLERLAGTFGAAFLPTSVKTGQGRQQLLDAIAESAMLSARTPIRGRKPQSEVDTVTLTARHRQAVAEAIGHLRQAIAEIEHGDEEVAVLLLRAAHQAITEIERQPLDEQVLDRIFRRFCIGK